MEKRIVKRKTWEVLGYVDLDVGIIQIGDHCYTSEGRNHAEDWDKFCENLLDSREKMLESYNVPHDNGGTGKAFVIGTLYGDGTYEIEGKRNSDGRISEIRIKL